VTSRRNENGRTAHDVTRRFNLQSAQAHTVDMASTGVSGGNADVGTFGGAIGDCCVLFSYDGHWYQVSNHNVTWA